MSRTSRIPHPPGSRFVQIYAWVVARWGLATAAVLGLLDFFDRCQPDEGMQLASRARIIADLEGIVGRDAIDRALHTLLSVNAIKIHRTTVPSERNLITTVAYSLNVDGIAQVLGDSGAPDFRSCGNPENQDSPGLLTLGRKSGVPSVYELDLDSAAAPRAHARGTAGAAAIPPKRRQKRASGIVTWLPDDVAAAERLEQSHPAEQIALAVSAVERIGKHPVPGLVAQEVEKLHQQQEVNRIAEERKAAASRRAEEQRVAQLADPATAIGAQIYLRRRKEATNGRP